MALVATGAALAMLAWWSLLAAERAALRATEDGARRAAVVAALTLDDVRTDAELADRVALAEQAGGLRLVVTDRDGDVLAGRTRAGAPVVRAPVAGRDLTVAAEVPDAGLGVGRYSRLILLGAFLGMAAAASMLSITGRARQRAEAELDRLGRRWDEAAAADDLTGLGNRTRLLEDAAALIARGSRYGNSFGLAVFAIEGDVPDTAIQRAAETLAVQARGADLCYRVGRDRFVTVLPEQDETGATRAAERIRRVLSDQRRLDVRIGVAAFSPWLPCAASDLLTRAELDLAASAIVEPSSASRPAGEPGFAVTPPP